MHHRSSPLKSVSEIRNLVAKSSLIRPNLKVCSDFRKVRALLSLTSDFGLNASVVAKVTGGYSQWRQQLKTQTELLN